MKPLLLLIPLFLITSLTASAQAPAVKPDAVIDLMGDPEFKDFTHHLNPKRSISRERDEIWSITEDGLLHVSGKGWGYLRTNAKYRDYHLVLEYQWGEHTWPPREDGARDCGLLVHGFGRDGAFAGSWMNSIEAQLIEGGSGNLNVLAFQNRGEEKAPTRLTAEVKDDRNGEPVWTKGGEKRVFPPEGKMSARINSRFRDPDWTDLKGYRGAEDNENPVGEWNRMEVICEGDSIRILVNGELVNEATKANPSEGFIGLQSEAAECWIRRYELHPLGTFEEEWQPEKASTNTGYSETGESILPRRFPLSPEESLAAWEIDGDYELQIAAAEPIVCDPVDVVWDEQGRMFVAEMRDYPLPPEAGPLLSRIRLLSDTDGDGRMDEAKTWADNLDHVQGLIPVKGGLIATSRTAILFLKDTDGDDVADEIRPLFQSNEPRHNQLQVSCPRWGLDNAIYLNNGLDGKEIYPEGDPDAKLNFTRLNLRYDPRTKDLITVSGAGQFGASQDDWGRRFFCTNRNPVIFAVIPLDVMKRNPYAGITTAQENLQPQAAPVWPINLSHTTSVAHAGTHTAACGHGVYRGDLIPDLRGDIFVCEPTAQLVTRNRLVPNGGSLTAERVGEKRDFLASADEWSRPVNIRNGPDGALYICDMYRRYIDHARFFPEEFQETNYMRAGFDHGRIWRLVPKGKSARKIEALPEKSEELVKLLEHENAWHRIHAQRLLVDRQDKAIVPAVEKLFVESDLAQGRLHALWTLHGLGTLTPEHVATALKDPASGVVENAIGLSDPARDGAVLAEIAGSGAERHQFLAAIAIGEETSSVDGTEAWISALLKGGIGDPWMRKAVLSASSPKTAEVLEPLINRAVKKVPGGSIADFSDLLREFTAEIAARGDVAGLEMVLGRLAGDGLSYSDYPIVEGLATGLRRSKLPTKNIAALLAKPPDGLTKSTLDQVQGVLDSAEVIALDRKRDPSQRVAALPLVQQQGADKTFAVAEKLIDQTEPVEVQKAACQMLSRVDRNKVADFFFERWDSLPPTPRREALALIAGNGSTGLRLMKKMKAGEISKALMPPMQRWSYARSSNAEIKALATELFGQADADRAKVIADYKAALPEFTGDPEKGRAVFQKAACITCHKIGDTGVDVGPNITDVRIKPPEALLSDILDPNRMVEERWTGYTVETRGGQTFAGLIDSESASGVVVKMAGGVAETIPRDEVKKMQTTGLSLMPVGLEGAISKEEMAHLIAFLKSR